MTDKKRRVILLFILGGICFGVVFYYFKTQYLPIFNPKIFTEYAIKETGAQNLVTAIYLKFRLYDTLFEALMLAVAVMGVLHFSWGGGNEE